METQDFIQRMDTNAVSPPRGPPPCTGAVRAPTLFSGERASHLTSHICLRRRMAPLPREGVRPHSTSVGHDLSRGRPRSVCLGAPRGAPGEDFFTGVPPPTWEPSTVAVVELSKAPPPLRGFEQAPLGGVRSPLDASHRHERGGVCRTPVPFPVDCSLGSCSTVALFTHCGGVGCGGRFGFLRSGAFDDQKRSGAFDTGGAPSC